MIFTRDDGRKYSSHGEAARWHLARLQVKEFNGTLTDRDKRELSSLREEVRQWNMFDAGLNGDRS
jgi:hypothetical protein